jgi:hypothetical protein
VAQREILARIVRRRLELLGGEIDITLPQERPGLVMDVGSLIEDLERPAPMGADPPIRHQDDWAARVPILVVAQHIHSDHILVPGLARDELGVPAAHVGRDQ